MGDVLIGEIKQGYGHSLWYLLNKCETSDKNRIESNAEMICIPKVRHFWGAYQNKIP